MKLGAFWTVPSRPKDLPVPPVATAAMSFLSPSPAKAGLVARRATRGAWRRPRRTQPITPCPVCRCVSGGCCPYPSVYAIISSTTAKPSTVPCAFLWMRSISTCAATWLPVQQHERERWPLSPTSSLNEHAHLHVVVIDAMFETDSRSGPVIDAQQDPVD